MPHSTHKHLPIVLIGGLVLLGAATVGVRTQGELTALPLMAAAPADNPTTPEKVALGKALFWDPILSGHRDVACATCHHPQLGYADGLDVSIGVQGVGLGSSRHFAPDAGMPFVKRNSQTVLNAAFNGIDRVGHYDAAMAPMFWDLRVRSLEAQALEPLKAFEEMRGSAYDEANALASIVLRINGIDEYRQRFSRAFGGRDPVSATNIAKAIASFERSLVTPNSPFDRYMRGDTGALTQAQERGMRQFVSAGCVGCHNGPMLSDFKSHVLGIPDSPKHSLTDAGTNAAHAFRTPTLRNLAYTAPYMHSGTFSTLNAVLDFYDNPGGRGRGGRGRGGNAAVGPAGRGRGTRNPNVARNQLDPLLLQVNVRGRREIVQFLGALNDDSFDKAIPERVPSGLTPGGQIH